MKRFLVQFSLTILYLTFTTIGFLQSVNQRPENRPVHLRNQALATPPPDISICSAKPNFELRKDTTRPFAPIIMGIGNYHYAVTTHSKKAQEFFDQGLRMQYAFNHGEAFRSFKEAARLDPDCAMAYWGQALALGPNINDPLPDANRYHQAWQALEEAEKHLEGIDPKEKALIKALKARYTNEATPNISELNTAYYQAMKKVAHQYKDDPEIQVLYVAALMNTMPWDYWTDAHQPKEGVQEGIDILKKITTSHPEHPGAHHYYIHLVEAEHPLWAEKSADRLRDMMPAAGHIVHMPSHIYIRTGRYHDGTIANIKAIDADLDYMAQCRAQDFYKVVYFPHNYHFLWATASMEGNSKLAIEAAEKVPARIPRKELRSYDFMQEFLTIPLYAYVRFGKWEQIFGTLQPEPEFTHANALWYYARGMAFANTHRLELAEKQLQKLDSIRMLPKVQDLYGNFTNSTYTIASLARNVLEGEIAWKEGRFDDALSALSLAVEMEDHLAYIEPPAWDYPVRHNLGALLLDIGRPKEAEKVYLADLQKHPENGWALFGLMESQKQQGKNKEARHTEKRFRKAWKGADVQLQTSRF